MEDNIKQISSYQQDQEILDARGIEMTVAEVAGLATCKYAARLRQLQLSDEDKALMKSMRRRIKNRMASQNSRRRSVEHIRRLTRELRAVRACRNDALAERRVLIAARDRARDVCERLREHLCQSLQDRDDPTEVPTIDVEITKPRTPKEIEQTTTDWRETETPTLPECFKDQKIERDKSIFECRLDKLVQQSVNHIYNNKSELSDNKKKIFAKTVFLNEKHNSDVKNLIIKTEFHDDDAILDIKKEVKDFDSENDDDSDDSSKLWIDDKQSVIKCNSNTQNVPKITLNIPDVSNRKLQGVFKRNTKLKADTKLQDILNDKIITQGVHKCELKIPNITNGGLNINETSKSTIINGNFKTDHIFNGVRKVEEAFQKNNGKRPLSIEDVLKCNGKIQGVSNSVIQGVVDKTKDDSGVLNLCVKKRSHGRKQSAPKRIVYAIDEDDVVLDLKIKKEPQ